MRRAEQRVVAALKIANGRPAFVLELCLATGLSAFRVYVILARLEKEGTVQSDWVVDSSLRRRAYWLSAV